MQLKELATRVGLETLTPELTTELEAEVKTAHASDLLSDILTSAPSGALAITIQAHLNTVAVAVNARLAGVVYAAGRRPGPDVIDRAEEERVPLFVTQDSTFDVAGRLYEAGIRGVRR
jgi:hypothetical protein